MNDATQALGRLQEGNRRFVDGSGSQIEIGSERRQALVAGQQPFAIILGCADSRVPAELIFDQGLGELFVIRVAGNVVEPSLIGSVEYAVEQCGTRLVVVLGHTGCGAVQATLSELERPSESLSPNLHAIVDRIRPSVETLLKTDLRSDREALLREAVRANVRTTIDQLRERSKILERRAENDGLMIVGAEYSLETGAVEFLTEIPNSDAGN